MSSDVVGSKKMRTQLQEVIDEGWTGEWRSMAMSAEEQPFLVLNPGYHNGKRASFLFLPKNYYEDLLRQSQMLPWDLVACPVIAVTDRAIVMTLTAANRMVHLASEITSAYRKAHANADGLVSFFDSVRDEGLAIPSVDHAVFFDEIAISRGLRTVTWGLDIPLDPNRFVRGKGGDA